jgi:hypothetical protein
MYSVIFHCDSKFLIQYVRKSKQNENLKNIKQTKNKRVNFKYKYPYYNYVY